MRRELCAVLGEADRKGQLDSLLRDVMRLALRSPGFEESGWRSGGPGIFLAPLSELKLDLHTGEVFWRNDDLKPVPDSISQFSDYQAMFRGDALHCGVVAKQQRRQWIHIVGTEYDLVEWDEPDAIDQGDGGGRGRWKKSVIFFCIINNPFSHKKRSGLPDGPAGGGNCAAAREPRATGCSRAVAVPLRP